MDTNYLLLVEDNPDDEILTLRALEKHSVANRVVVVRDGAEALDYLFGTGDHAGRDLYEKPTAVLLDLKLPKIDGLQVLKAIRTDPRTKLLPVVVLTSSDEQRDLIESYNLGANSYVRKPVETNELTAAIGQLGLYWLILNRRPD